MRLRTAWNVAGVVGVAASIYALAVRPWHLRWGASEDEVRRALPGDGLVGHPMIAATRAVTVDVAPEDVWPWLLQQGYGRAGWYAYRIDNAWRASPDRIVPEWQHVEVGDVLKTGRSSGFRVAAMEPNRYLLLVIDDDRSDISVVQWLEPIGPGRTRLLQRLRAYARPSVTGVAFMLATDPGDFPVHAKADARHQVPRGARGRQILTRWSDLVAP